MHTNCLNLNLRFANLAQLNERKKKKKSSILIEFCHNTV